MELGIKSFHREKGKAGKAWVMCIKSILTRRKSYMGLLLQKLSLGAKIDVLVGCPNTFQTRKSILTIVNASLPMLNVEPTTH